MSSAAHYRAFLESKVAVAGSAGFEVLPEDVNPALKPFVRKIVIWAASGGRRGIFSSFGLHKTSTQLELARLARIKTGVIPLIILPLGVRQEFFEEAEKRFTGDYAVDLRFIKNTDQVWEGGLTDAPTIYLTNYESVRDGKIDTSRFGFVSLDEAACLRGFGGSKTFREFMAVLAGDSRGGAIENEVRFRYVATATPDPNEHIELLAYAAFLGIMDVGQAKTRFFKRNSEAADQLTLHPHKEREFWLWVASWALFVRKPSDLGPEFSDEGYDRPTLDIRWHELPADHSKAGTERDGQGKMFVDTAIGVQNAARVKRDSLTARVEKMLGLLAEDPRAHCVIWHDLEDERRAIEAALPSAKSIYGSQDIDFNEAMAIAFKRGFLQYLATKPRMSGAGCNFQAHCHWAIFLGIGFKFHDFIQAVHRLDRFGQTETVRLDLIFTEEERPVKALLEERWRRHEEQAAIMADIIREYGLARASLAGALVRTMGVERAEVRGERFVCVNNDCVEETRGMPSDSVDLIVTSIPFSTQYEYTPSYNDFGHTDDDTHFFRQMDFLIPELLRVLKPGRVAAIHCKDRIVPGGLTGLGFQTVSAFVDDTKRAFKAHGFAHIGQKVIITDVVRENNQTYRLGWTEQCKDGSRMGNGLPEYVLTFRKPQTDRSKGYADDPVVKDKEAYTRARWQLDAHGFHRSSGNRLLTAADLIGQEAKTVYRRWRDACLEQPYDFEEHVALCEAVDSAGELPSTFMLMPPHSWHPDVESNVARMRTLNGVQHAKGREVHLCPLQFDIVDRAIIQYSMEGETVFDPFGGIMTVPYRAIALKRRGVGVELSPNYFRDGALICQEAEREHGAPTLFDLLQVEAAE